MFNKGALSAADFLQLLEDFYVLFIEVRVDTFRPLGLLGELRRLGNRLFALLNLFEKISTVKEMPTTAVKVS